MRLFDNIFACIMPVYRVIDNNTEEQFNQIKDLGLYRLAKLRSVSAAFKCIETYVLTESQSR